MQSLINCFDISANFLPSLVLIFQPCLHVPSRRLPLCYVSSRLPRLWGTSCCVMCPISVVKSLWKHERGSLIDLERRSKTWTWWHLRLALLKDMHYIDRKHKVSRLKENSYRNTCRSRSFMSTFDEVVSQRNQVWVSFLQYLSFFDSFTDSCSRWGIRLVMNVTRLRSLGWCSC